MYFKVYSKLSILKLDQDYFNHHPETEDCSDESNCYFKQK